MTAPSYIHEYQILRTGLDGVTHTVQTTVYPNVAQDCADLARIVYRPDVIEVHLTDDPEKGNVEGAWLDERIAEWEAYKAEVARG